MSTADKSVTFDVVIVAIVCVAALIGAVWEIAQIWTMVWPI
jgi:hypothetical protein